MEIITVVMAGAITHTDSMGNRTTVGAGDVQRMSAGTGVMHSEFNLADEPVHLYQIWLEPDVARLQPSYDQKHFVPGQWQNRLLPIASGRELPDTVTFHTDATIYRAELDAGQKIDFAAHRGRSVFMYLSHGRLAVNGQQRRVDAMKQETLAMTLRYKLGLTGTKLGCDRAECGACTVLIDDVPHYSCSVLTHSVRGRQIRTIEGLAAPTGELHPIQRAVVDEQGFQCAFCLPGFVMAATGFLKTNPNPTREELAHGISGNLCRCQDYDKILTALMRGAEYMRGA